MSTDRPRIGVREVAARAGVSSQTVSRVLNDHPHIRTETRHRVLAAMDELGYRVNNAARALGTSTTRTLGVLVSDATLFGPAVGVAALEAAARAAGHWIANAYADGADPDSVRDAVDHLLAQGVDGIIVVAAHDTTLRVMDAAALGVPWTVLHGGADGDRRQSLGAGLVVEHLAAQGHRRIALVSGPTAWSEATARERGAVDAAERAGIEVVARWSGDWTARTAAELAPAVAATLRDERAPTAIVVANDQMALGLVAGLEADGIRVPDDVAVAGFDDNPDAAFYRPPLTTVSLDLEGEARRCVAVLLAAEPVDAPLPARLIARASTAQAIRAG